MDDETAEKDVNYSIQSPVGLGKPRIIKNLFVLSSVFILTFTANEALTMLQSTLNHQDGIGVACQSIMYACNCISALLLPKYVMKKMGCKVSLVTSMCLYVPYIASNWYPHWGLMVPAAAVCGLASPLLWSSVWLYLNKIAAMYATPDSMKQSENKINIFDCQTYLKKDVDTEVADYGMCGRYRAHTECKITPSICRNDIPHCSTPDYCQKSRTIAFDKDTLKISPSMSDGKCTSTGNVEATTVNFFGIFGTAFFTVYISSNLLSYFILVKDTQELNVTLSSSCVCGALFCNVKSDCFINNLQEPSVEIRKLLTAVSLSLIGISLVILIFLLDPLNDLIKEVKFSMEIILATFEQTKKMNQALLIPLTLYIGMLLGFYNGDFNMSFVGCAWGTYRVGLVGVCYGAMCAVASFSGTLVSKVGRIPVFTLAALLNLAAHILLLTWSPDVENPAMFFVIAGVWGTSYGIFWSQTKAMYGFLFKKDEEAAFAGYQFWGALGYCLSFAYSGYLCMYVKIYIMLTVLVVGMIGYLSVDISIRRRMK